MTEPANPNLVAILRLIDAWLVVLVPLAWGVYKTAMSALVLFR
jgi:hypothetical protein